MYKFIDKGSTTERRLIKQSGLKKPTSSEVFHLRQKANNELKYKRYEALQMRFLDTAKKLDPAGQSDAWGYIEKGVGLHRGREGRGITAEEYKNINRRLDRLEKGDVKDIVKRGNVGLQKRNMVNKDISLQQLLDKVNDDGYGDSLGNAYEQEHAEDLRTAQQAKKAIEDIKSLTIGKAQNFINQLEHEALESLPSWVKSTVKVLKEFVNVKGRLTQLAANHLYNHTLAKYTEKLAAERAAASEDAIAEILELLEII